MERKNYCVFFIYDHKHRDFLVEAEGSSLVMEHVRKNYGRQDSEHVFTPSSEETLTKLGGLEL